MSSWNAGDAGGYRSLTSQTDPYIIDCFTHLFVIHGSFGHARRIGEIINFLYKLSFQSGAKS